MNDSRYNIAMADKFLQSLGLKSNTLGIWQKGYNDNAKHEDDHDANCQEANIRLHDWCEELAGCTKLSEKQKGILESIKL